MPEKIYKLQPHRTMHLRGFDRRGAAAALWGASDTGFTVSGVFRDPADFCVLILFDADDVFSHPRWRYLPDFDFTGITLQFDVTYTNLQPLDSPKFPSIDWPYLDITKSDGTSAQVKLWDHAAKQSGGFSAASLTYTLHGVPAAFDRVTLWYQNLAFDYIVPGATSVDYQFFATGTGTVHSITIGANTYSYTEAAGDSSSAVASALAAAINGVDPNAAASASANHVILTPTLDNGSSVACSATDGNGLATLYQVQASTVLRSIRDQINGANWPAQGAPLGLRAAVSGSTLVVTAARYGTVNTSGITVTWASGEKFTGIDPAGTIQIGGAVYNISSVDSPTQITLAASAGAQSGAAYLADRGGEDGNMIALCELHKNDNLYFTPQGAAHMTGGGSAATWQVTLDFSSLGITSIRQMWMTFAPLLTNGAAYASQEWTAVFTNWTVTDPNGKRPLKVAAAGSERVGSRDSWAVYTGSWTEEAGFYWKGFARRTSTAGDKVVIEYHSQYTHDLYLGTSLYTDRGKFSVSLDGDASTDLDCYLNALAPVVTRRLVRSGVAAGKHSLTLTLENTKNAASSSFNVYFDYLEAAVAGDVPDAPQVYSDRSVATDFDTDHAYKLSPQRLVWMIGKSGLHGDIDHYAGVFWWNQRKRAGGAFPSLTVTFSGTWADGDAAFLQIGGNAFNDGAGTVMGKSVFPADTTETIAAHFASFINETFVGVWASSAASVLTITCRSPEYSFTFFTDKSSAAGTISVSGSLSGGVEGTWQIDDTITPVINRAAADWHRDYFAEIAAQGWTATAAFSMELVDPPDDPPTAMWSQRFRDNVAVLTATGFANLNSTQCAFSDKVVAYQKEAFKEMAGFMNTAGLTPWLQFGEFLWWFLTDYSAGSNPAGGMAYYDAYTAAQALTALGRPLASFLTPGDDPSQNNYTDANFLRSQIKTHIDAIRSYVLSAYPDAKFELLWPLDVNYPPDGNQLNRYVNLPAEYQQKSGSGLDRLKMEALAFGSAQRNLDKAQMAMRFPYTSPLAWAKSDVRYLLPWFNGGCPWAREYLAGCRELLPNISFWAWDHLNLFGWPLPLPAETRRSALVNA